jgi:type I restriction enzyme M protein
MNENMSYSEGKAIVMHSFDRIQISKIEDKTVFIYLLHLCRQKIFDDYKHSSFRNDYVYKLIENKVWYGDIENHDILRELTQVFNEELSYFDNDSQAFYDIVYSLMDISSEWYDQYYTKIFDELILLIFSYQQSNQYFQPIEITRLIAKLTGFSNNGVVYNPFAGIASYGVEMNVSTGYFAQEQNKKIWAIGVLHLLANNICTDNYECQDSILYWKAKYNEKEYSKSLFDVIVATPPFGMRLPYEEFYIDSTKPCNTEDFFIARGIEGLSAKGKLIGLFTTGVLFKGGATVQERKFAVDNDYLEMIVSLPANLLQGTAISTAILLFSKNKSLRGQVKFVDGSTFYKKQGRTNVLLVDQLLECIENNDSQYVRLVSTKEIIENDYNLSVNRYFYDENDKITIPVGFKLVKLGEIAYVVRGERNVDKIGRNVKISDLKSDPFNFEIKSSDFEVTNMSSVYQKISSNVMLLSKINALKPTYCFVFDNESIHINNNIVAFNVDHTKVDVSYLILELNSERTKKYITSCLEGITIPAISMKDMLEIPVLLPPLEQQFRFVDDALKGYQKAKIEELGFKIENLTDSKRDTFEKNMHLRKHALEQVLNRLAPGFSSLKKCMEHNDGKLSTDMIVNSYNGDTVSRSFEKLENLVTKLELLVDRLVDEQTYGETEEIWIETFLEDYEKNHNATNFPVKFVHQREKAENDIVFGNEVYARMGDELSSYSIRFSPKDLSQILENIITNANKYGFTDKSRNNYEVQISLEEIKDNIIIKVANNGASLHPSMTTEKLFTWGGGDGTGLGLWQVRNIVEHFNGTVEAKIYDEAFSFEIRISLPITNRL